MSEYLYSTILQKLSFQIRFDFVQIQKSAFRVIHMWITRKSHPEHRFVSCRQGNVEQKCIMFFFRTGNTKKKIKKIHLWVSAMLCLVMHSMHIDIALSTLLSIYDKRMKCIIQLNFVLNILIHFAQSNYILKHKLDL